MRSDPSSVLDISDPADARRGKEESMAHLSVNPRRTSAKRDCPLPVADTYANAILRTLSSFKPPSPTVSQHHRSRAHAKTVSQGVVNEVSGLKPVFPGILSLVVSSGS